MSIIVNPCIASPDTLTPLSALFKHSVASSALPDTLTEYFRIEYFQKSVSAWILFVCNGEDTRVLKILCNYKDERYELDTVQKRQACQFEAFQCNSVFSPTVYYGVARLVYFDAEQQTIGIEKEITDTFCSYSSNTEYALVMRQLPLKHRLDYLLHSQYYTINDLKELTRYLTNHIVQVHTGLPKLSLEEGRRWGSFHQLHIKLQHNLALANPIYENTVESMKAVQDSLYNARRRFTALHNTLLQLFTPDVYGAYTDNRVQNEAIKRCHADLKAPNIWVEEDEMRTKNVRLFTEVSLLDAIDFNKMYSIIDTLSDFATLVVDIQARTQRSYTEKLAQQMVDDYLIATGQNNEECLALIHYYLIEKAYVGAALSIVYDKVPELGLRFLDVAEAWANFLLITPVLDKVPADVREFVPIA